MNSKIAVIHSRYGMYHRSWPIPISMAYVREYPHKIWPYMVQYLHFRILEFPLKWFWAPSFWEPLTSYIVLSYSNMAWKSKLHPRSTKFLLKMEVFNCYLWVQEGRRYLGSTRFQIVHADLFAVCWFIQIFVSPWFFRYVLVKRSLPKWKITRFAETDPSSLIHVA